MKLVIKHLDRRRRINVDLKKDATIHLANGVDLRSMQIDKISWRPMPIDSESSGSMGPLADVPLNCRSVPSVQVPNRGN